MFRILMLLFFFPEMQQVSKVKNACQFLIFIIEFVSTTFEKETFHLFIIANQKFCSLSATTYISVTFSHR